jgi:hypothetical protein
MKRTLLVAAMFGLFVGTAYADHGHGGRGPVIRDHRGPAPSGPVVRDHRGPQGPVVVHERRGPREHIRVANGRYVFPGGVVRVYHRPVIREHYYNVHVRPAVIVENYDPVPGYVWMRGEWTWGGSEWVWSPGYWAVAEEPAPAPVVTGGVGVSIGGGISIH